VAEPWEITEDDIQAAREAWERDARPKFRRLLDAELVKTKLDKRDEEADVI
jgi:hypothetical protein